MKLIQISPILVFCLIACDRARADQCEELFNLSSRSAAIEQHQVFQFPAHLETVELDFSNEPLNPKDFENRDLGKVLATKNQLTKVGDFLNKGNIANSVKTVLYPFSGYDVVMSLGAFPEAQTVIAVDIGQFVASQSGAVRGRLGPAEYGGAYHTTGQSDLYPAADAVLARLMLMVDNLRVRRIISYVDRSEGTFRDHETHGVIEFDQGPSTQVRRYIHINSLIDENTPNKWWYQEIIRHGFEAMILKGATGGFDSHAPQVIPEIASVLANNRGVYLSGDGKGRIHVLLENAGAWSEIPNLFWGYTRGSVTYFPQVDPRVVDLHFVK